MRNLVISAALLLTTTVAVAAPETVVITYRAKKGSEAELQRVIEKHWATIQRLGLVAAEHQLFRGEGSFFEILTWKDESIPDHIPPEVGTIWKEMNGLVDGKDGLSFAVVGQLTR
jgi:hypothetical protein